MADPNNHPLEVVKFWAAYQALSGPRQKALRKLVRGKLEALQAAWIEACSENRFSELGSIIKAQQNWGYLSVGIGVGHALGGANWYNPDTLAEAVSMLEQVNREFDE